MALINCEIHLILTYLKTVIFNAAGPTIFAKTGTKLPASIVILSIQDNSKLLFC